MPVPLNLGALEKQYGLPSGLLTSVMQAESGGNPNAISPKGALGLFQFLPQTAKEYGINPLDPAQAAEGAARMYSDLSSKYSGDLPSMLAGYNWGQGNVDRKGLENAPPETQGYISKVLGAMGEAVVPSAHADELPPGFELENDQAAEGLPPGFELEGTTAAPAPTAQEQPGDPMVSQLGRLAAVFDKGVQGMSFGFGDEVIDPIAAGIVSMISDTPFGETYKLARDTSQKRLQEESDKYPYTSFAADVGGMILSGAGLAKLFPGAASALKAFAKVSPYKAAAVVGSAAGAARGAGEGTDTDSRIAGAQTGGALGALLGPVGVAGGRAVARVANKAGSALGRVAQSFGKAPVTAKAGGEGAAALASLEAGETAAPSLTREAGELFPKTAGQRTQSADLQRAENAALAGTVTPEAQQAGFKAVSDQNAAFKGYMEKLGGNLEGSRDVNAVIDDVAKTVKSQAGTAKQAVNSAYDLAREGTDVKIGRQEIQQGLWKNLAETRREGGYDLTQMPLAKRVVQRLAKYSSKTQGQNITAVKLGELENFRKQATNALASTADKTEKRFLGQVVRQYDDFMEHTAENAVDINDYAAIKAFRGAVAARRDYGRLFESNKLVESIVGGEKSLDDTVKHFIGTGSIKGRQEMANNLTAVLKASGKEAKNVQADLQNAFMQRVYKRALSGSSLEGQPDVAHISPAKLRSELESLFVDQSKFAEKLYGKDAAKEAHKAIKELKLITSKQPSTTNPSGSGEFVTRFLMPIINRIPGVPTGVSLAAGAKQTIQRQQVGQKAIKSFAGVVPKELTPTLEFTPRSTLWLAAGVGQQTGSATSDGR